MDLSGTLFTLVFWEISYQLSRSARSLAAPIRHGFTSFNFGPQLREGVKGGNILKGELFILISLPDRPSRVLPYNAFLARRKNAKSREANAMHDGKFKLSKLPPSVILRHHSSSSRPSRSTASMLRNTRLLYY
jgi:hypothetical protein